VPAKGQALLKLYRAAREHSIADFSELAFSLLQQVLFFDSARLIWGNLHEGGLDAQGTFLYRQPTDSIMERESIHLVDPVYQTVLAETGVCHRLHMPSVYAPTYLRRLRLHAERYRQLNTLTIAHIDASGPEQQTRKTLFWLALWHHDQDRHFSDADCKVIEFLMPHLAEAFHINTEIGLRRLTGDALAGSPDAAIAMARPDGLLYFAGAHFHSLLRQEFRNWNSAKLPQALLDILLHGMTAQHKSRFAGVAITVTSRYLQDVLVLRASIVNPLQSLSTRELCVANLYATGKSYKDIAQELTITPVTVRNFIQRIYSKLALRNKSELITLVLRGDHS